MTGLIVGVWLLATVVVAYVARVRYVHAGSGLAGGSRSTDESSVGTADGASALGRDHGDSGPGEPNATVCPDCGTGNCDAATVRYCRACLSPLP